MLFLDTNKMVFIAFVFRIYFPEVWSLIRRTFPVYKVTGLSLKDLIAAGSRTFLFATTSEMPVELRLIIFSMNR